MHQIPSDDDFELFVESEESMLATMRAFDEMHSSPGPPPLVQQQQQQQMAVSQSMAPTPLQPPLSLSSTKPPQRHAVDRMATALLTAKDGLSLYEAMQQPDHPLNQALGQQASSCREAGADNGSREGAERGEKGEDRVMYQTAVSPLKDENQENACKPGSRATDHATRIPRTARAPISAAATSTATLRTATSSTKSTTTTLFNPAVAMSDPSKTIGNRIYDKKQDGSAEMVQMPSDGGGERRPTITTTSLEAERWRDGSVFAECDISQMPSYRQMYEAEKQALAKYLAQMTTGETEEVDVYDAPLLTAEERQTCFPGGEWRPAPRQRTHPCLPPTMTTLTTTITATAATATPFDRPMPSKPSNEALPGTGAKRTALTDRCQPDDNMTSRKRARESQPLLPSSSSSAAALLSTSITKTTSSLTQPVSGSAPSIPAAPVTAPAAATSSSSTLSSSFPMPTSVATGGSTTRSDSLARLPHAATKAKSDAWYSRTTPGTKQAHQKKASVTFAPLSVRPLQSPPTSAITTVTTTAAAVDGPFAMRGFRETSHATHISSPTPALDEDMPSHAAQRTPEHEPVALPFVSTPSIKRVTRSKEALRSERTATTPPPSSSSPVAPQLSPSDAGASPIVSDTTRTPGLSDRFRSTFSFGKDGSHDVPFYEAAGSVSHLNAAHTTKKDDGPLTSVGGRGRLHDGSGSQSATGMDCAVGSRGQQRPVTRQTPSSTTTTTTTTTSRPRPHQKSAMTLAKMAT